MSQTVRLPFQEMDALVSCAGRIRVSPTRPVARLPKRQRRAQEQLRIRPRAGHRALQIFRPNEQLLAGPQEQPPGNGASRLRLLVGEAFTGPATSPPPGRPILIGRRREANGAKAKNQKAFTAGGVTRISNITQSAQPSTGLTARQTLLAQWPAS